MYSVHKHTHFSELRVDRRRTNTVVSPEPLLSYLKLSNGLEILEWVKASGLFSEAGV